MSVKLIAFVACVTLVAVGQSTAQETITTPIRVTSFAEASAVPQVGPHNGTLRTVDNTQVETVVSTSGIRVYLYSSGGDAITIGSGRGVATLSVDGKPKRYRYNLVPAEDASLKVDVDLSSVAGRQVSLDFQLVGVSGASNGRIVYRDVAAVPASRIPTVAAQEPRQHLKVEIVPVIPADTTLIQKQANCPVMDEPLGSMGGPIKLLVDGQPIFLCCKGCVKKVKATPEKYLAMVHGSPDSTVPRGTQSVRENVFKVAQVDQPFINLQKVCPVMDEPLDAMGGPYKVHAAGKAIYICCPGCAKKITADPQKYIGILARQGVDAPLLR